MGEVNKLTIEIDGVPLLRRTAEMLCGYPFVEVVAVLGHESEQTAKLLEHLPIRTVINPDYAQGQMTSMTLGASSLTKDSDGIMIFLSDLVMVDHSDIALIHQHFDQSEKSVVVPRFNHNRGNPIILANQHKQAIVEGNKNLGCRNLINKNPELVDAITMPNDHVICDMDTPEDVEKIKQKLSNQRKPIAEAVG
jgi:molybdenum cofactor cytidylyltransferase